MPKRAFLVLLFAGFLPCSGCLMAARSVYRSTHPAPRAPLFNALDKNRDGVIDASEIANAPATLQGLDRDGDGKISPSELKAAN